MADAGLVTNPVSYRGLSSDTKPASAPEGSRFCETDTYDTYTWHNGAWVQDQLGWPTLRRRG